MTTLFDFQGLMHAFDGYLVLPVVNELRHHTLYVGLVVLRKARYGQSHAVEKAPGRFLESALASLGLAVNARVGRGGLGRHRQGCRGPGAIKQRFATCFAL